MALCTNVGNENSAQSFSDRSFWKSLRVVDVRAFGSWISAPKCLFFSRILSALTEVLGRDIRANDPRMSAGYPSQKLPLWADFSFLNPDLLFLAFFGKQQGKPPKGKDFFGLPNPKILGKEGKNTQNRKEFLEKEEGKENQNGKEKKILVIFSGNGQSLASPKVFLFGEKRLARHHWRNPKGDRKKSVMNCRSRGKNRISQGVENRGSLISVPLALRVSLLGGGKSGWKVDAA